MRSRTFAFVTGCVALAALVAGPASGTAPAGRYAIALGGEVYDNATKLTWQRNVNASNLVTQAQAASYCSGLGGSWRLPNIVELRSIVDRSVPPPNIDTTFFPGTPVESFFWTSTPVTGADLVWVVTFGGGNSSGDGAGDYQLVRCVH